MVSLLLKKLSNVVLNNKKSSLLAVFLCALFNVTTTNAQVANYQVSQLTTGTFTPLTNASKTYLFSTTPTNIENGVAAATLPFSFNFNGNSYTSMNVSLNGFLTFGATMPSLIEVAPIASTTGYSGAISVFGADLDLFPSGASNNVAYTTTGTVGTRIFKLEWVVKRSNNPAGPASQLETGIMAFQVWLYEGTNIIEMYYNPFTPTNSTALYGQIGLRGTTNADFNCLNFITNPSIWPASPSSMPVRSTLLGGSNTSTVLVKGTNTTSGTYIGTGITSNRLIRWTPLTCPAPTALTVAPITITGTSASLTFTGVSPVPGLGYQYYISTSSTLPTTVATPVFTATSPQALSGLVPNTTYYVYVRSKCSASDTGPWSTGVVFTTLCNPFNVPYYEPFDGPVISGSAPYHSTPALVLPACTSQQNVGSGNPWVTSSADYYPESNLDANLLMYNGQNPTNINPANVWFYTAGINMLASKSYAIDYYYGGTDVPSTVVNKMLVAYGTAPVASAMTIPLDDHTNIKASPFNNIVTFTPPADGVYYFGMKAYSEANNGQLFVDELNIYESFCLKPIAVSVSGITGSTATLSWTPPIPAPASGYVYYFNTTGLAPTNGTVPSGTTGSTNITLTGLSGLTTYYFWVRSSCGAGSFGEWVPLNNSGNPSFTTLIQLNYCVSGSTGSANYFTNFVTNGAISDVSNATGYATGGYANYTTQIITQAQLGTVNVVTAYNDMAGGVGIAMWVDWNQDGTFDNATERVYNSAAYLSAPPTINFTVPATALLGFTRMRIVVDWNATSPSACATMARGETEDYGFQVVTPPPPLTLSNIDDTVCAGQSSNAIVITAGLSSYNTFSWSPASGVTGSGTVADPYIITSNTTQVYTLTATQTASPFRFNKVKFTFYANPLPTPITVLPSAPTTCQSGPAVQLTATGGIVSGFPILSENFNASTNNWTIIGSGTGSPTGNWMLRPDGYNIPLGTTHSNDSSQFYHANSDSPGIGTVVTTTLTSPAFSTVGYSQASLSFWHVYRYFSGDNGKVQISTNGTAWTDLATYSSNQGVNLSTFVNVIIPLNAYLNQATVYIRFKYDAGWDWFWGIDNVLVSGSASSAVTWNTLTNPVSNGVAVPGLFTNAAATLSNAYIAGTGSATVYALPSATTTFTASASTPAPVCSAVTNVPVTVIPIVAGTASSDQIVCSGAPADLVLTGTTGTITQWQYASDIIFTTPISIPGSASATLTSAQIGTISGTRYFRAIVTNGTCTSYSNVITISVITTTWNGTDWDNGLPTATKAVVFNGLYNSTGDVNACSVSVISGAVVFNSGHSLIVQNAVDTSVGGSLTFENNASLVQVNNTVNLGPIIYKRNTTPVRKYDYTYWSSPVTPQSLVGFSPLTLSDKYFSFNPLINNWVLESGSNLMTAGKGYIIRSPQTFDATTPAVFNGQFTGVPNNGPISAPILIGAAAENLIGNPYPSAIDIDNFFDLNGTVSGSGVIEKTIYLWTHNTMITANVYVNSDYAVYNSLGGVGTTGAPGANNALPNGNVASGQSFFIKGLTAGTAIFNNSMRITGNNNQFYRPSTSFASANSTDRSRVWLEVFNNEGAYKQTLVGYTEEATNLLDSGFDSDIMDAGTPVLFYSKLGNSNLAIQGRSLPFDVNDSVPLGFKSTTAAAYEIKLSNFDGIFDTQEVYLEDKLLQVIHNLKTSNYSFVTNAGTFDDRFVLRYTTSALSNNNHLFTDNSVVVYKENQTIHINASTSAIDEVKIFDIRGRLVYSKSNANSTEVLISNLTSSQQVLLITIKSIDGTSVTKKLIY